MLIRDKIQERIAHRREFALSVPENAHDALSRRGLSQYGDTTSPPCHKARIRDVGMTCSTTGNLVECAVARKDGS